MKTNRYFWIIIDVIIAALIGILGNILADDLKARFLFLGDLPGFIVIGSVFVITLSISIFLRMRKKVDNVKKAAKLGNIDISSRETFQQVAGRDIQQNIYAVSPVINYLLLIIAVLALTISVYSLSSGSRIPSTDFPQPASATVQPATQAIVATDDKGGVLGDDKDYTPPLMSGPIFLFILSIASVGLALLLYHVAFQDNQ